MSLIGCGVMTGVGAALYSANVQPGQSVAVIGCGGVGDSVIMGAKLAGATTIIAVDIDPRKLEWAKGFGATHTVNPKDGDAVARIKAITGGTRCQLPGSRPWARPETIETALWCRDLAGTCVIIGVAGPHGRRSSCRSRSSSTSAGSLQGLLVRRLPADPRFPAAGRAVRAREGSTSTGS